MGYSHIIKKLNAAKTFDVARETANIINENEDFVRGLLLSQINRGVDADERPFGLIRRNGVFDYYSDATVFQKNLKGQEVGIINYKDTGLFQETIFVFASIGSFVFDSEVPYFFDILAHAETGERIIELSKANMQILMKEIIIPQLQIKFKEHNV